MVVVVVVVFVVRSCLGFRVYFRVCEEQWLLDHFGYHQPPDTTPTPTFFAGSYTPQRFSFMGILQKSKSW